mgnify:CR=1 FL=1
MKINQRSLKKSDELWQRAQDTILSGCQLYSKGPETHIKGVSPIYIDHGKDGHVWDPDGNEYIDYDMGLGPILLGYQYKAVDDAVMAQLRRGMGYSLVAPEEVEYAELCVKHIPSAGKVRFLKTGSSATEAAVRIARCYTGRKHIVRGEYHGWHEWTTAAESVRQGGILPEVRQFVHKFDYNDLAKVEEYFETYKGEIAAVITEAVEVEPPKEGFLEQLKELCHRNGALLIFDEVVNGFRFSIGGAQAYFGVTPDLSTFGKAAANGMPLSIVAGRKDIMECISPLGGVYQAGTLSGNPIAVAAGLKTLEIIQREGFYENLTARTEQLVKGFQTAANKAGVAFTADSVGGMFGLYFSGSLPQNYADMAASNIEAFKTFFHGMLDRNTAFGPSAYEAGFVSAAHTPELIDETIAVAHEVFKEMAK